MKKLFSVILFISFSFCSLMAQSSVSKEADLVRAAYCKNQVQFRDAACKDAKDACDLAKKKKDKKSKDACVEKKKSCEKEEKSYNERCSR